MLSQDEKYMRRAIALARKGAGWVNPNPMVGAVVVKDGRFIGTGFHEYSGGPHAEVNALQDLIRAQQSGADGSAQDIRIPEQTGKSLIGIGSLRDATMYVTLEPCSHHGKTPPCTNFIVESGIGRVVIGMTDPNPLINGRGVDFLRSHNVDVTVGVLESAVKSLNEVFIKFITTKKPFVVLKTAMTLDGKIATVTNASRWITGEASRKRVHRMRQQFSAVMVGVDTVLFDNPQLNIRLKPGNDSLSMRAGIPLKGKKDPNEQGSGVNSPGLWKNPLKIIADTRARIPINANVLQIDPQLTVIATTDLAPKDKLREIERMGAQVLICPLKDNMVDLRFLLESMGLMGIDSVMIEGGSTLAFSALKEGVVDKVVSFIAPKILGGSEAPTAVGGTGIPSMDDAIAVNEMHFRKIGKDLMVEGYIKIN
ncbi:MAG: bifunctional diaminohydroxyphosphoribosylaminopyrimidine deaminase/5-amino-6-(5-phosphoribosylamino)uracil reductase RibD [Bacteroidales bacterium]|jgi:diaminohydroxyphosphoribosylaminopyrimidine deaminase/5-amino-6-(5-phosphoribosylamino)uracil reductase|nr:bifunctional diaminohydroxyphosphoribosylaminopyrimidine deaminase/5-amino-6-(5-phosphoribosylamino)uracil reductase RibD [Bacteroidales bacterium]